MLQVQSVDARPNSGASRGPTYQVEYDISAPGRFERHNVAVFHVTADGRLFTLNVQVHCFCRSEPPCVLRIMRRMWRPRCGNVAIALRDACVVVVSVRCAGAEGAVGGECRAAKPSEGDGAVPRCELRATLYLLVVVWVAAGIMRRSAEEGQRSAGACCLLAHGAMAAPPLLSSRVGKKRRAAPRCFSGRCPEAALGLPLTEEMVCRSRGWLLGPPATTMRWVLWGVPRPQSD